MSRVWGFEVGMRVTRSVVMARVVVRVRGIKVVGWIVGVGNNGVDVDWDVVVEVETVGTDGIKHNIYVP